MLDSEYQCETMNNIRQLVLQQKLTIPNLGGSYDKSSDSRL